MKHEDLARIAGAKRGYIEAAAGAGKTEAIAQAVAKACGGTQLVLTHTHAGVDVLKKRLRTLAIPTDRYHVDTIAGWAWKWVRSYPKLFGYASSLSEPDWDAAYAATVKALNTDFVRYSISCSYEGVFVDEYQDCTERMHEVILALANIVSCRVLGDDLQAVFNFGNVVQWSQVVQDYGTSLASLVTPHRWMRVGNDTLGNWLINARADLRSQIEPRYSGGPVTRLTLRRAELQRFLFSHAKEHTGTACIIVSKHKPMHKAMRTMLARMGFVILEPYDLKVAGGLIRGLSDAGVSKRVQALQQFIDNAFGGVSSADQSFVADVLAGIQLKPKRPDRAYIVDRHRSGLTPELILDILAYLESQSEVIVTLRQSVTVAKAVLEAHLETQQDLRDLFSQHVMGKRYNRSGLKRCVGSTLLVKGLEFEHVIVVRETPWQKLWGNYQDLYVALSRGSRSVVLVDLQ